MAVWFEFTQIRRDVILAEFKIIIKTLLTVIEIVMMIPYTDVKKIYNQHFFGYTRVILIKIFLLWDS